MRRVFALIGCLLLVLAPGAPALSSEPPLRVLFLGDNGQHQPANRAAQLIPVLAGRGIDVTYTEDVGVLDADFLSRFDAFVLYANIERIAPERVAGLVDYVESGGGFVALHSASYCALNSPEFAALVGARFLRHGTGEFETEIVAPEHPIMKGFVPFATWDETYVHEMHNETNRTVLQTRSEGDGAEPWTWVRAQGKGRVFYTAYGHDYRTWMQPGFQALVERGIRWAAGKGDVFDSILQPREGLPPFEYTEALLPNYIPSEEWGTQGEPIRTMQKPLEPAESLKHLVVPPGFEPRLYAAEPNIVKPIAMAWDRTGRLWIAETFDYPNNKKPPGQGRDRITICKDTDGDGEADSFQVFADKLSIPTSLAFAFGGVIVHQAPHTLFLKDTNGDDVADVREPIITGWKTDDTHAGPSNLRYGFDNWYYGMVGYAGFEGTVAGEELRFRQGFYRFQLEAPVDGAHVPRVSKLEFLRSTSNNSWGVGLSEEGLLFGSTANGCPSVFAAIPNRYYESVSGWAPRVLESISPSNRFFPITEKVRQVDWHGGFSAAAGHALYTARVYPELYWNSAAFVCGPTGHLAAAFVLMPRGSDFVAFNSWNLAASDDEWTAPIAAEVGPDGHVWIIDWYNYIVQHNPTPRGFETGKGNAYVTPLRDKRHGRIYRIEYQDRSGAAPPVLDISKPKELVAALDHPNLGWRLHAQRLLIERGKADVVEDLVALSARKQLDQTGLDAGAVHALCVLDGLGVIKNRPEIAAAGLSHPSAAARRIAAGMLPAGKSSARALLASKVLNDDDPQVRLAALLALSERPESEPAASAVAVALLDESLLADHWFSDALTVAAAAQAGTLMQSLQAEPLPDQAKVILTRVAEHYARSGQSEELPAILAWLSEHPNLAGPVLAGFAEGTDEPLKQHLGNEAQPALEGLFPQLDSSGQSRLVRLADLWGVQGFEQYTQQLAESLADTAGDENAEVSARMEAARRLIDLQSRSADAVEEILDLVTPQASPELRKGLIEAAAGSQASDAGGLFVERLSSVSPAARQSMVEALMSRTEWTRQLMEGIEKGDASLSSIDLGQRQRLANHPDEQIAARATKLMEAGGGLPDADRQKVIVELLPNVSRGGDIANGQRLFKEHCGKCHVHSGQGSEVGPDLTGMASHPRDDLLVHILDPSRSVEGNYRQYTAVTSDGLVIAGLLASETRTSLELVDSEGKRHSLVRDDVEELIASDKSVMPAGFEKQITPEGMRDLLAFLTHKGKFVPLDLREVATITSARGMFFEKESMVERIVLSDWSPRTIEGVPFHFVDPQEGRAANVILLHSPQGAFPPRMPKQVRLPVHTPAKAIHFLGGVAGWAFPYGEKGSTSLIVRLHYADGTTEDHAWRNGIEVADYIRPVEVPGSKLAFEANGRQVRYLAVAPKRDAKIAEIELVEGPDDTAPLVMAITVETFAPE